MNSLNPLVSVCVQTYQHVNYIKQCLDGILMQETTFPIEVILGEDESNDGTREICMDYANKYPDKIKLFLRSRKDVIYINGQATGRYNFIENLKASKGKYIAICEGDDYWTDPLKLQKQVDFLEANPDYAIHSGAAKILNEKGGSIPEAFIGLRDTEDSFTIDDFLGKNNLITCTVLFRNCLTHLPSEFKVVKFGDWFLYTMLLHQTGLKAYRGTDVMAVYRVHGKGLMSLLTSRNYFQQNFNQVLTIKHYVGYKKNPPSVIQWLNNYSIPKFRYELAHNMYKNALKTFLYNIFYCKFRISVRRYLSVLKHNSWRIKN
ncbi:glycosyltransferase [Mariniflexile sp. HNIBRBA6329]|uniref:glycosyltransferase n=1 Tax=Mariniflexile sp. HNIBRBA6329 TaxID=3373088 RepID=UPI0037476A5A